MMKIEQEFLEKALTSFLSSLTSNGYTVYAYDSIEDEDISFSTNQELAQELLWAMDMHHLIIENKDDKHTVVQIIPENKCDLISDYAPYHCHNDEFVRTKIDSFGEYLEEHIG